MISKRKRGEKSMKKAVNITQEKFTMRYRTRKDREFVFRPQCEKPPPITNGGCECSGKLIPDSMLDIFWYYCIGLRKSYECCFT